GGTCADFACRTLTCFTSCRHGSQASLHLLPSVNARHASAAVQKDAPRRAKSLIRNCPASPRICTPWPSCNAPGVVNRKLVVNRNVAIAPRLPRKETRAEKAARRGERRPEAR